MQNNGRKRGKRKIDFRESRYRIPNCSVRDVHLSRRVSSEIRATDRTVVVRIVASIHAVRYHAARPAPAIKKRQKLQRDAFRPNSTGTF